MTCTVTVTSNRLSGVGQRAELLVAHSIPSRIAHSEASLWGEEATPEASIRLGWVADPRAMRALVDSLHELRQQLVAEGVDRVILCGMGGSSLAPEVMARRDGVELQILDSTHPDQVQRTLRSDLARTVVVVSSKSGTTVETATARATFEQAFTDAGLDPRQRVIIVTDPDSPLHRDAEAAGHKVFLADPMVGGRFSALTAFGLVPTTLAGVNTSRILDEAADVWQSLHTDTLDNPAVQLAAALGQPDRDIAVLLADEQTAPGLGDWIEQLVAESTGKDQKGVLPVVAEGPESPEVTLGLEDVVIVDLQGRTAGSGADLSVSATLGGQFVLWEYATAMLGYLLELNPFDQPDVESAKAAARGLLDGTPETPTATAKLDGLDVWLDGVEHTGIGSADGAWSAILGAVDDSGYLALHLYIDRLAGLDTASLRSRLARRLRRPVTVGFGPRFLHSTGQFHKGGTPDGVFVQVLIDPTVSVGIPGYPFDFGTLIDAQAAGDRRVLVERGRPVLTVRAHSAEALTRFLEAGASPS